jgi:hypothetical protein
MKSKLHILLAIIGVTCLSGPASATARRFGYTNLSTTAPKGSLELETFVTWKHRNDPGKDLERFDFRYELEYGLTDQLLLAIYVADWTYNNQTEESLYQHSGVELIYNLTNPNTHMFGSGVYFEALLGERVFELEGKFLLQKNLGPLVMAYNLVLEAEWEGDRFGDFSEHNGEFKQTFGISYDLNKNVSVGLEAVHEIELEHWDEAGDSVVYAGPNILVRGGRYFAVVTTLFQLTDVGSEPDVQTRLIFGVEF